MEINGKYWRDYGPELNQVITDWLDDVLERAVTEYVTTGFKYIEGNRVVFRCMDQFEDVLHVSNLEDDLLWDVAGHQEGDGKVRDEKGRQNLVEMRAVLQSVITKIDACLTV